MGERGQDEEIKSTLLTNFRKKIQKLVDEKISEGYYEIEEMHTLVVEYKVEDMNRTFKQLAHSR